MASLVGAGAAHGTATADMRPSILIFLLLTGIVGCTDDDPVSSPSTSHDLTSAEPDYVTREIADRDGLRLCAATSKVNFERSYTDEYAKEVMGKLTSTLVVPNAAIQIGYAYVADGRIQIGDLGDPTRALEIFDNYRLPPPLEMYCYLPDSHIYYLHPDVGGPSDTSNPTAPVSLAPYS